MMTGMDRPMATTAFFMPRRRAMRRYRSPRKVSVRPTETAALPSTRARQELPCPVVFLPPRGLPDSGGELGPRDQVPAGGEPVHAGPDLGADSPGHGSGLICKQGVASSSLASSTSRFPHVGVLLMDWIVHAGKRQRSSVPVACLYRAIPACGRCLPRPWFRALAGLTLERSLVRLLTMTMMPLGEVKSHLSELVGRVHDHHERVTVTVHGKPSAVLVAVEDLERLEETLAIMRDADTMRRLAESDAELARGEEVTADQLAETMRNRLVHE